MSTNNMSKIGTLTVLALSIAACTSNPNSHSPFKISSEMSGKTETTAERQARIKAAQEARLKAEAEAKAEAERVAREKAEQERLAKEAEAKRLAEEAEKARLAQEEADRIAAEKAEQERQEQLAREAEAKRLAEEEARKAREAKIADLTKKAQDVGLTAEQTTNYANANADRSDADAKAALDAIVKENRDNKIADLAKKATDAGLPQTQAENYAKAQADATNAEAKAALDKLVADRQAVKDDLKQKALDAGLSDEQIQNYVAENIDETGQVAQAALNEIVKQNNRVKELVRLAIDAGLSQDVADSLANNNKQATDEAFKTIVNAEKAKQAQEQANALKGEYANNPKNELVNKNFISSSSSRNSFTSADRNHQVIYNLPYSVVVGDYQGAVEYNNQNGQIFTDNRSTNIEVKGLKTAVDALPNEGRATYSGLAFNGTIGLERKQTTDRWGYPSYEYVDVVKNGKLSYTVDFAKRVGFGRITGLGDDIVLDQGSVIDAGISSTAKQLYRSGNYQLSFYGPTAEEVAGKVSFGNKDTVGFGGTRDEITK